MWKACPLCIFWLIWKAGHDIVFRSEMFSFYKSLKSFFVHLFLLKTVLFLVGGKFILLYSLGCLFDACF